LAASVDGTAMLGFGAGADIGAAAASSSAMICLIEERISSIDGSLVAGLFIKASFNAMTKALRHKMRLIRHCLL
jgi:hypothetical protein